MFRRAFASLALVPLLLMATPVAQADSGCQFILGFKTLHDMDPSDIGDCTDSQAFAANGDAQQHSTKGLLAWRKADNWTAFTNGYWTWINGPNGLAKRLNTQRFSWEANPTGLPTIGSPVTTAATPPTDPLANFPPAPSTGTITLDARWASAFAKKYASIGGVTFNFTVKLNDAASGTPGDYPFIYADMNDTANAGNSSLGLLWLQLPKATKQQAVSAMLQDLKAHWPNRMVALDIEGEPFYTWHYYPNDAFTYQDHSDAGDSGFYTVLRYGTAMFDPETTGDDVQVA